MFETFLAWPLLVSLLSLSPEPPKIIRSHRESTPGVTGNGEHIGYKMPLVVLPKGPSYMGAPGPQGPGPQPTFPPFPQSLSLVQQPLFTAQ